MREINKDSFFDGIMAKNIKTDELLPVTAIEENWYVQVRSEKPTTSCCYCVGECFSPFWDWQDIKLYKEDL